MNKQTTVLLLFITACFIGFSLVKSHNINRQQQTLIKVGVIYGFTGPASTWSDYGRKALELAAEEINRKNKKRIELIFEDSKTDPTTGLSAFRKLVDIDNVNVIIGDVWAFTTNPLIPLSQKTKTVLLSPTSNGETIDQQSDYFFTLGHSINGQKNAVMKFFETNPEIKTVSILCWNDSWGQAHSTLFHEIIKEKNLELRGEECTSDYSSNYRTEVTKIKSQNPDAILMVVTSSLMDVALKRIQELNVEAKILTTNNVVDALEVRNLPRKLAEGIYFTNWVPNQSFIEQFQNSYGVYPILEAQNHYEALKSILRAFENDPENILYGLEKVKYEGVGGEIDFTANNHLFVNNSEARLYRVDANGYTEVK